MKCKTIGIIRTPYTRLADVPTSGNHDKSVRGRVELLPVYARGLKGLEKYKYIYLLFSFHKRRRLSLNATPPGEKLERGVFASRSPRRPTGLGMTIVRLHKVRGRVLEVSRLDMLDKTPLLDIKPYYELAK